MLLTQSMKDKSQRNQWWKTTIAPCRTWQTTWVSCRTKSTRTIPRTDKVQTDWTQLQKEKKREILHIDYCKPMRLVEFREKIFSQKEFHHGIDTYVVRTSNLYLNKHAIHVGIFFFHILKNIYIFVLWGIWFIIVKNRDILNHMPPNQKFIYMYI